MVAQRGADRRPHADVHAAVARDHDEGEVVLQAVLVQFAAPLALPEHLDHAGQRGRPVLEQVVDIRRLVRRVRIARRDDHGAAGLDTARRCRLRCP